MVARDRRLVATANSAHGAVRHMTFNPCREPGLSHGPNQKQSDRGRVTVRASKDPPGGGTAGRNAKATCQLMNGSGRRAAAAASKKEILAAVRRWPACVQLTCQASVSVQRCLASHARRLFQTASRFLCGQDSRKVHDDKMSAMPLQHRTESLGAIGHEAFSRKSTPARHPSTEWMETPVSFSGVTHESEACMLHFLGLAKNKARISPGV